MGEPVSPTSFTSDISITKTKNGLMLSQSLVELLVIARQNYDWPAHTGACISQHRIISLEKSVSQNLVNLNPISANKIVIDVSIWAGNNNKSHNVICSASHLQQKSMEQAIRNLLNPENRVLAIRNLCSLPGIGLVIASKIFRFCCPKEGASVDRHASYFFNSLAFIDNQKCTEFHREWTNAKHISSRLAIYSVYGLRLNEKEYFTKYLPLLRSIADSLNTLHEFYRCEATGNYKKWYPADVEMAAYYWWACNGAK
jgi:hypothetical protein